MRRIMAAGSGLSCTLLLLIATIVMHSSCIAAKKEKEATARKSDVKFIKCDVCEEIVKQLSRQYKRKKEELSPKKITEFQVIEMVEKICDPKREEGDWVQRIDIVEDGDKLKLVEQDKVGECRTECKTIQRACQEVIGDHDTDVAEAMYAGEANRAALSKLLCRELSKACVKKPPPVPKDRVPGEEFKAADEEKAKMEKVLRNMNVKPSVFHDVKDEDMPGAPKMKMYSRDDLMKSPFPGMGGNSEDDDEEEEEEDEEEEVVSKIPVTKPEKEKAAGGAGDAKAAGITDSLMDKVGGVAESVKDGAQQAMEAAKKGAKVASDWVGGLLSSDKKEPPKGEL